MRLDNYLVENNLAMSRTKAQSIIKNSLVSINAKIVKKSAYQVEDEDRVEVAEHLKYVSRSANKLKGFLTELDLDIKDAVCLDIGASTGGFTQVLLEYGVKEVSAVDVGSKQLHGQIKNDQRVFSYENCDIRDFKSKKVFDLVVSDVAFISLLNILDAVDVLANDTIILLFKPQFEVGREAKRDKHGVVLDVKAIEEAMQKFEKASEDKGWDLILKSPSTLTGKEGNLEYCYCYKK